MTKHETLYWRRKLHAYLHDSPNKVLDILDHENSARRIAAGAQFLNDEQSRKEADWAASAADRLPWPIASVCNTATVEFRHPLDGSRLPMAITHPRQAEEISQKTRPVLDDAHPRRAFLATWRFWRNWASSARPDFAHYPGETRLPDHTIWSHLAVTSALQGCFGGDPWKRDGDTGVADRPCFLLFTIGPVQDFIAAARSTRDLWSGSYLLSYLIGTCLHKITLDFGPDHVLFPNLCGQPIIDLLLKREWGEMSTGAGELWQAFDYYQEEGKQRLLTPSLPNRFLAVLPSDMVEHKERGDAFANVEAYAKSLAKAVRDRLSEIGTSVSDLLEKSPTAANFDLTRFKAQVESLLEIHWQVLPWPQTAEEAKTLASYLPPDDPDAGYTPRAGLETIGHLVEKTPNAHRDKRYFSDIATGTLKQSAAAWSAIYASAEWMLDGTKASRAFPAWREGHWISGKTQQKDSLNGKEEACLSIEDDGQAAALNDWFWKWVNSNVSKKDQQKPGRLFKDGERFGASTLLKRLWHLSWLCKQHSFFVEDFAMPNTRSIAASAPWANDTDDSPPEGAAEKHFAILALDGDEMGKWISGSKCPSLESVISTEANNYWKGADLKRCRPLSPSWHLQFSEALANYGLHAVRRIVEAFNGRLIYAGGDDVLAMLPAETAVQCAHALRLAFRGDPQLNDDAKGRIAGKGEGKKSDRETRLFQIQHPGFLQLHPDATPSYGAGAALLSDPVDFPVLVPGPGADVSVGIAIAHFKSPLQDIVRAAQVAEKRAKNQLGRAALSVTIVKRSGEILEWGTKWESGGLAFLRTIRQHIDNKDLSAKFPHRVEALLAPYLTIGNQLPIAGFAGQLDELISKEFSFAADRQCQLRGTAKQELIDELLKSLHAYLRGLHEQHICELAKVTNPTMRAKLESQLPNHLLQYLIGLMRTASFTRRINSND